MTYCSQKVIDFDEVKEAVFEVLDEPKKQSHSADALVMGNNSNYFIEFKNGNARDEKQDIHAKARDSELLLNYILDRQIDTSRKTDVFILVYNENVVKLSQKERIARGRAIKADRSYALFGLGEMEGFCYSKVLTLNQVEFNEWLSEELGW